jgi:CelD/BcsL family acetyltransferase involved in cellulose biosynthesis
MVRSMGWRLIDFDALAAEELASWQKTRAADPALDSPFFHPAFAGAVHAIYGDVQVATQDRKNEVWFPVQLNRGIARPVGWPGADFEGPVVAPGVRIDPLKMVQDTGIHVFEFEHLSDGRPEFGPWVRAREQSPFIDTTDGLDGYLTRVSKAGRDKMSRVRRRTDKAIRELGEVRLVWHAPDPALLDRLIEIKRTQYHATGEYDFFASPRRRELVHQLAKTEVDGFAGVLSALYAGETLLAAHFGLRDGAVFHYWFPVYNRAHSEMAPGWIWLRETIAAAPGNGVARIDLGKGDEDFKLRAMTGAVSVCAGEIVRHMWRRQLRLTNRATRRQLNATRLGPRLLAARNRVRRLREGFH